MSALGSLFTEDFMSLHCIDLYETDRLLLFRPKSSIWKMIDLERVKEKAENIINFYLDSNWEFRFICVKIDTFLHISKELVQQRCDEMECQFQ